jgi:PAS domain S-box-containing protein
MRQGGDVDSASGDGTGRRRLEETLRESEERFRRLVEAAKDYAIFMTDADGRVSTWNEGAERLFGYREGEIVGEDGAVLFTPEDRESGAHEREMGKARAEGRAEDERWHLRKDGTRFWASGFVRPILDEEGALLGFSKVARDLTERRRAEEAVDEARWAERDRLARDLHDLVLQDLVYALQAWEARRLAPREDEEDVFDPRQMSASLRRACQGVRQAVYELRAGETVGRALARAVEDLVGMERRRSPGIHVELAVSDGVPEDLPPEVCKDVLLVVGEALANARRHASARRVRVALGATDEEIRVEVADDGAGFDPRQTPEGVGLSAMRERTALLNGRLEVLSEPAGGTTVRLRVPRPA